MIFSFRKNFLFNKKLIAIISLYFFPITLHSQKPSVSFYIWKDVQQKINTVEFFNFHNFPSGQAVLIYDPQKQGIDFVYFNFEPFIKVFVSSIAETHPQISEQTLEDLALTLSSALVRSEDIRLQELNSYLHIDDIEVQQNVIPFFKAISNRDTHFFNHLTEKQKRLLRTPFLVKVGKGKQEQYVFVSNFLLEAIRQTFLHTVQYILSNYRESDLMPKGDMKSLSLDPLSLALLTYASLEPGHPLKEEARDIVRLVADHTDINNTYNFPVPFNSIIWAFLFGLKEEVEFLHEEKKARLNYGFLAKGQNWRLRPADYANSVGFVELGQYLQDKRGISVCEQTFFQ